MTTQRELELTLNHLLSPHLFKDYCPNGLQVAGKNSIKHLVTGVTASLSLIEQALNEKADAILVHHGLFWQGDALTVTGVKRQRLYYLLTNHVNLFAYHLPLDAHPRLGNNAQLAELLGIRSVEPVDIGKEPSYVFQGELASPMSANAFLAHMTLELGREPLLIPGGQDKPVEKVVFCTGAAQRYIDYAAAVGADAFITGEASEQTVHLAREMKIHFYAAGHHATERYGVKAVGNYLATELNLNHTFIDIDNPV